MCCRAAFVMCFAAVVAGHEDNGSCLLQTNRERVLSQTTVGTLLPQTPAEPSLFWGYSFSRVESASLLDVGADDLDIKAPSAEPYQLRKGTQRPCFGQWGQDKLLYPILSQVKNGFFVESGAFDGEEGSNTLMYERHGWKGLLVEPGPVNFDSLVSKHRRAYAFRGALSPSKQIEHLKFSGTSTQNEKLNNTGKFDVVAAPLADLVKRCNSSTVDFWSLDIEGSEGAVLEATDFSKVEVGVLLIEMNKGGDNNARVNAVMTKEGFIDIGYSLYNEGRGWEALDHIFVNPKYFKARGLQTPPKIEPTHVSC